MLGFGSVVHWFDPSLGLEKIGQFSRRDSLGMNGGIMDMESPVRSYSTELWHMDMESTVLCLVGTVDSAVQMRTLWGKVD